MFHTLTNESEVSIMKKWKYDKELTNCKAVLLSAYLATMHSKTITVIFTNDNKLYYHDCTIAEITELARLTDRALSMQAISKKRLASYINNSIAFAELAELTELAKDFEKVNNGWLAEYLYRIKVNNESVNDIKKANNSKGYDIASDTKDGKQIKNIDKGATFTKYEYLLKACERANYKELENVKQAIATLNTIYGG